jgi:hypothetical protein
MSLGRIGGVEKELGNSRPIVLRDLRCLNVHGDHAFEREILRSRTLISTAIAISICISMGPWLSVLELMCLTLPTDSTVVME